MKQTSRLRAPAFICACSERETETEAETEVEVKGGGVSYGGKGLECFRICLPPINARSRQTKKSVDRSAQHRTVIHRVLV